MAIWEGLRTPPKCRFLKYPALKGRVSAGGRMNRIQVWTYATRPKTLVIGISPVLIGSTLAIGQGIFHPLLFLFTMLTALAIQIGTNLANDYFDFMKGADTKEKKRVHARDTSGTRGP